MGSGGWPAVESKVVLINKTINKYFPQDFEWLRPEKMPQRGKTVAHGA
jgi:hypothetical protein